MRSSDVRDWLVDMLGGAIGACGYMLASLSKAGHHDAT